MKWTSLLLLALGLTPWGCGSTPSDPAADVELRSDAGADADVDANPSESCAPIAKTSKCKTGKDSAIVRGVARFDPDARTPGTDVPTLQLFLRHSFVLAEEETTIGGRLHAYKRIKLTDEQIESGTVPFEIDLCNQGVAMWSEENRAFNLVAILDENREHDANTAAEQYPFQTPKKGELVKMISGFEISCHASSPCLDVPLDCTDGTDCTTIVPITQAECRTPACESDSSFCEGGTNH